MLQRSVLCFIAFLFSAGVFSQTVEGVWKGKGTAGGMHANMQLTVYFKGETLLGETYFLFPADTSFLKFSIEGSFNERDSTFKFEEKKIISSTAGLNTNCYGNYTLRIKSTDTGYVLTGTSVNYTRFPKTLCGRASFVLTKPWGHKDTIPIAKNNPPKAVDTVPVAIVAPPKPKDILPLAVVKPPKVKDSTKANVAKVKPLKKEKLIPAPVKTVDTTAALVKEKTPPVPQVQVPVYKKRIDAIATTIITASDSVHIDLYDNGIVDHDTVTLYVGDQLLVLKRELTTHPISVAFHLNRDNSKNILRYVAENLGEIPPNTGLLVIHTKEKEYQVFMQADFDTNNIVNFILKE